MVSRSLQELGLASSGFTSFSLAMIWETEKHYLSLSLELVLLEKAPEGHTKESSRENLKILTNLGHETRRKIIPSRLGEGEVRA